MCQMASFVLTKDRVFFSKEGDSHEKIIEEHKLNPDGVRGPNVVRVEIAPPGSRYDLPLDQWVYKVDQDQLPDWHDPAKDEARTRKALVEWADHRIIRSGIVRGITKGQIRILLGDAQSHEQQGGYCLCRGDAQSHGQKGGSCDCYDNAQSHGQQGGECWCFNNTRSHGQKGGRCRCFNNAQSHGQKGGDCRCFNNAQSHGQLDGECYCRNDAQSHGQKGGSCDCYDNAQSHGQQGGNCNR